MQVVAVATCAIPPLLWYCSNTHVYSLSISPPVKFFQAFFPFPKSPWLVSGVVSNVSGESYLYKHIISMLSMGEIAPSFQIYSLSRLLCWYGVWILFATHLSYSQGCVGPPVQKIISLTTSVCVLLLCIHLTTGNVGQCGVGACMHARTSGITRHYKLIVGWGWITMISWKLLFHHVDVL